MLLVGRWFQVIGCSGWMCLIGVCIWVCGCTEGIKVTDRDVQELSYPEVVELMSDSKAGKVVVVDVREPGKFSEDHLPGAVNIPLPQLMGNDPRLAEAKTIVVYGGDRTDPLSPAAAKKLMGLGYRGVYDYRGGLDEWRSRSAVEDNPTP